MTENQKKLMNFAEVRWALMKARTFSREDFMQQHPEISEKEFKRLLHKLCKSDLLKEVSYNEFTVGPKHIEQIVKQLEHSELEYRYE